MDNLDDSENNAKISDSAYSNSCSNSQSRRSHSSKSTHSGSNSSGSSGYAGKPSNKTSNKPFNKPSTSGFTNKIGQPPVKRIKEKESKKKKQTQAEVSTVETVVDTEAAKKFPEDVVLEEEIAKVVDCPAPTLSLADKGIENMEIVPAQRISIQEDARQCDSPISTSNAITTRSTCQNTNNGFACVISMHDGVVIYATSSITTSLGFPKNMWIGRSFINFVHPRDRNTFASQITSGLAVAKSVNGTIEKVPSIGYTVSTMVCRIRRYRGITTSFDVKERVVTYVPFLLKLSFKNITDEDGKVIYLVIQAMQFTSAFKIPKESIPNAVPFVIRHTANGHLEYIDPESVPYLGYLPQDLTDKDALKLYHPDDLTYLSQVYETIVKEGGAPRSKSYRIMSQNGDFLKVETEWSSFINPWSRKLEFIIGKHHIIEGPLNPDVFHPPSTDKPQKVPEEEVKKAMALRESIVRIMNEVLTKPAEMAKQNMSKRCQDLASFMESLIEEEPKMEEELRVDIQDPDNSYYERDSVMLGGISPHHDYNDSKSSTETPLSYNQLNYNENLQRYFDSHETVSTQDAGTSGENPLALKESSPAIRKCLSPMAHNSGDSLEMASSMESGIAGGNSPIPVPDGYAPVRLTESLINKHNTEMEKELVKMYRENRSGRGDKDKLLCSEVRQRKKGHFGRNSIFQAPSASNANEFKAHHGVKRASKLDQDLTPHKHHCSRQSRRKQSTSAAPAIPSSTITTTVGACGARHTTPVQATSGKANTHWTNNQVGAVGMPQQMSIMSPMAPMQGMFPLYYVPAASGMPSIQSLQSMRTLAASTSHAMPSVSSAHHQQPMVPYMMYGQPMYGSPFMYSPINPQVPYSLQENLMAQTLQFNASLDVPKLPTTSKSGMPLKKPHTLWRERNRLEDKAAEFEESCSNSSTSALRRESGEYISDCSIEYRKPAVRTKNCFDMKSTEAVPSRAGSEAMLGKKNRLRMDESMDRTDGESSYSSFYSSFFKTDSGSAEESGDAKRTREIEANNTSTSIGASTSYYHPKSSKKMAPRRKLEPPWIEHVCVTSEMVYKYQILTKSLEEVLKSDQEKINKFEQPSLVNEQLGQLYLDLQLEGMAVRLTLEEGITSSSSSGEESTSTPTKVSRRKREYSKLVMIYEEDTPLPPADVDVTPEAATT